MHNLHVHLTLQLATTTVVIVVANLLILSLTFIRSFKIKLLISTAWAGLVAFWVYKFFDWAHYHALL